MKKRTKPVKFIEHPYLKPAYRLGLTATPWPPLPTVIETQRASE